jgi:transposase
MRFYTQQHQFYCGVDLHARSMYLCIIDRQGEIKFHDNMKTTPENFLKTIKPFRDDIAVCCECTFSWYWLCDLCARENIPFVLGHALYMKAIHGGKAKNDRIDSEKIARLLKGGMIPVAYAYPEQMRSTRDLLRRRTYLVRKRAELLTHIKNTNSQYNLPEIGKSIPVVKNQKEISGRFTDPQARKSIDIDLELVNYYSRLLNRLRRYLHKTASCHDPQALFLLRTIPGVGRIISMVILYEIHDINRFPRVQDFASYSRLVKCSRESAGKKYGSSGAKIGNMHLKWAFSEAAVMFIRDNPEGMKYKNRLAGKHGKAKALTILAHRLGRAVYFMLKRREVFDINKFLKD